MCHTSAPGMITHAAYVHSLSRGCTYVVVCWQLDDLVHGQAVLSDHTVAGPCRRSAAQAPTVVARSWCMQARGNASPVW
jgi:hypothetical protein